MGYECIGYQARMLVTCSIANIFSVGVGFGVLTAFGSYNERDSPAFNLSIIIAICNSLFSFIAGFAVFAALGYLAHLEGNDVADVAVSGPSL